MTNESRAARKRRGVLWRGARSDGLFLPAGPSRAYRVWIAFHAVIGRADVERPGQPLQSLRVRRRIADRLFRGARGGPGICIGALQAARALAARRQAGGRRRGKRPGSLSPREYRLSAAPERAVVDM